MEILPAQAVRTLCNVFINRADVRWNREMQNRLRPTRLSANLFREKEHVLTCLAAR